MTREMLLDTWEVTGNKFEEMYEITQDLDKATKVFETDTNNIRIFTLGEITDENVSGWLHSMNTVVKLYPINELVTKSGATPELIAELRNNSMMLFDLNDYVFYTSRDILKTLCQRAGSRLGDSDLRDEKELRFYRNAKFTMYMNIVPSRCHVIFREAEGAKKVIGILTDRHALIPQTESIKTAVESFKDGFGEPEMKYFRINSNETVCYIEFPEKQNDFTNVSRDNGTVNLPDTVLPGIMIKTADGGDSSFTVVGTIKIGNSLVYVPGARFARAHTKNANIKNIGENLKNKVFVEFTKVPERLCELLTIDIVDPVRTVSKVSKHCGLKKILGLGTENEIIKNITEALNPNVDYTAYDIASMFLEEGTRMEKEKNRTDLIEKIRECFVNAVFFKYEAL